MIVNTQSRNEEELEKCDWHDKFEIFINGKEVFSVYDGEPENNNIARNFNDVYKIIDIIKMAYEAGKNGEELTIDK